MGRIAPIHPDWLDWARRWAEDVVGDPDQDQCRIERPTEGTFDEGTGMVTPGEPVIVYTGGCVAQPEDRQFRTAVVANDVKHLSRYRVLIPITVTDVEVDDHIVFTASTDELLEASTLRVTDTTRTTFGAWRVLVCELHQS